jgi:hypothetical protein
MLETFRPGAEFEFDVRHLGLSSSHTVGGTLEGVRGGGFYGKVLLFDGFVVKTTLPDDWHNLWRTLNHRLPVFPPGSLESAAQLDHLATRIIHITMPLVTDEGIITPDSYGYTDLGPFGFAQVLERLSGRGARFDVPHENERIRLARERIWDVGIDLGLEQAAQAHPRNPFGKPNIWLGRDGQVVWLDVLPAIPHTGFVLPAFYFSFHMDVRRQIGNGALTFNRIHTGKLRAYLDAHPGLVEGSERDDLELCLDTYDRVWGSYQQDVNGNQQTLVINDAQRRGLLTDAETVGLRASKLRYRLYLLRAVFGLAWGAFRDFLQATFVYRLLYDEAFRQKAWRFFRDRAFRRRKILEKTILRGVEKAYERDLVTAKEREDAGEMMGHSPRSAQEMKKLVATYIFLQVYYILTGNLINLVSFSTMLSAIVAENQVERLLLGLMIDWFFPPLLRVISTIITGAVTGQDLRVATIVSAIPKLGSYISVPADIGYRFGHRSAIIWHYAKRGVVAAASKMLRPWGGWNTDLEERLWKLVRADAW